MYITRNIHRHYSNALLTFIYFSQPSEVGTIIICPLEMRKLRQGEVRWLAPHSAGKQWVEPGFKARALHYRAPADNRHHVLATVCFRVMWELRMFFSPRYIFKDWKQWKEYATDTVCGLQSFKYLLSDSLQKKFADPCGSSQVCSAALWWIEHPFQTMGSALIAVVTVLFLTLMKFFSFFMKFQGGLLPSCFLSFGGTYDPLCSGQC